MHPRKYQSLFWDRLAERDDEFPDPDEMEDRTTAAIIKALELVLMPWLEGLTRLDYEKVVSWPDVEKGMFPKPSHTIVKRI